MGQMSQMQLCASSEVNPRDMPIVTLSDEQSRCVAPMMKAAGWGGGSSLIEALIKDDDTGFYGIVDPKDDTRMLGVVSLAKHGRYATAGYLIVQPEVRKQGLGKRLSQHCIDQLSIGDAVSKAAIMWLSAASAGVDIYKDLGCQKKGLISMLGYVPNCDANLEADSTELELSRALTAANYELRFMEGTDLPQEALQMANEAIGGHRSNLVKALVEKAALLFDKRTEKLLVWSGIMDAGGDGSSNILGPIIAAPEISLEHCALFLQQAAIRFGQDYTSGFFLSLDDRYDETGLIVQSLLENSHSKGTWSTIANQIPTMVYYVKGTNAHAFYDDTFGVSSIGKVPRALGLLTPGN